MQILKLNFRFEQNTIYCFTNTTFKGHAGLFAKLLPKTNEFKIDQLVNTTWDIYDNI